MSVFGALHVHGLVLKQPSQEDPTKIMKLIISKQNWACYAQNQILLIWSFRAKMVHIPSQKWKNTREDMRKDLPK